MAGPQVHGRLVELGGRGRRHHHLAKLCGRLEEWRERGQPHGHMAEVHGGLEKFNGSGWLHRRGRARRKRAPAPLSSETTRPSDRVGWKRAPAPSSGGAQRKRATAQPSSQARFGGMARAQLNGRG